MNIDFSIKNVIWIRVGALGDLLIATAALSEILNRFPNAKVSILGPRTWTELIDLELYPRIDRIFVPLDKIDGPGFQVWRARNLPAEKAQWVLAEKIKDNELWPQFQAVVNHRIESHRYSIPAWRSGVPVRIGSGPWLTKFLFSHWSPDLGKDPLIHERDWHLRVATAKSRLPKGETSFLSGISISENRKDLGPDHCFGMDSEVWKRWQKAGLPQLRRPDPQFSAKQWGLKEKSFFLVNPTASRREKAWPSSKYRDLVLNWKRKWFGQVLEPVIVGAPSETDWLKEVAGQEFHLIQPKTIADLFQLVASARGLLTNASSMHFIAASTKTPAAVLMGRSDPRIWGPLGQDKIVVQKAPLQYSSKNIFVQEEEAYGRIQIEDVEEALSKLLSP